MYKYAPAPSSQGANETLKDGVNWHSKRTIRVKNPLKELQVPWRIHGTNAIFTYIYLICMAKLVGKYTIPMDRFMGGTSSFKPNLQKISACCISPGTGGSGVKSMAFNNRKAGKRVRSATG